MADQDTSKYLQLSLREAAKYDHERKVKLQVTGWGRICADRASRGVSRKARIARKKAA